MTDEQRMIFLNSLSDEHLRMLAYDWALWARAACFTSGVR